MPIESSPWERLSALPVVIESYEFDRRHAEMAYGFQRVTTVVRLLGGGAEGLGEDVSPHGEEDNTLHVAQPELPLAGEWTLGSLCAHLAELDQWPVAGRVGRYEALAQLGLRVGRAGPRAQPGRAAAVRGGGREPRPVRFVNSLGWASRRRSTRSAVGWRLIRACASSST
jgi:hypothetical protein